MAKRTKPYQDIHYPVDYVAQLLNVSAHVIRKQISLGNLRAVKIQDPKFYGGYILRVPASSIVAFLEDNEYLTTPNKYSKKVNNDTK